MEGLSTIFGVDNPYKFIFLLGAFLFITGLYYPYERSQELDFTKNKVAFNDSILSLEVSELGRSIAKLDSNKVKIKNNLDSLTALKEHGGSDNNLISKKINNIKNDFSSELEKIKKLNYDLKLKSVDSEYKRREIKIYERHLFVLKIVSIVFVISGLVMLFYGGRFWLKDYIQKRSEMKK